MEAANLYQDKSNWPVFSVETFPTENHRPINGILKAIEALIPHQIKIVTTTWGALGSARAGTTSISRTIHEKFKIPTVVHLTIQGKTRKDIEGILKGMCIDDLHNVLALGGDPPTGQVDFVPKALRHQYAIDAVHLFLG